MIVSVLFLGPRAAGFLSQRGDGFDRGGINNPMSGCVVVGANSGLKLRQEEVK